jgi:hypothetical protein
MTIKTTKPTYAHLAALVDELKRQRNELHAKNDALTAKVISLQFELGRCEGALKRAGGQP